MEAKETLEEYYSRLSKPVPLEFSIHGANAAHFNILKRGNCFTTLNFARRDYYKIVLTRGKALLQTEKGEVLIDKPALFFSDRNIRFGWENLPEDQEGFTCLFNEYFITPTIRQSFRKLFSLFKDDIYPFLFLNDTQYEHLHHYFSSMQREYCSNFSDKDLLLKDLLNLVVYTAIKIKTTSMPHDSGIYQQDIVTRFMDLLDNQFPIESPVPGLQLRTPAHFADNLHIHVNHLNHSLKVQTGKTTSDWIKERILAEAVNLLLHSGWRIAEIANGLGFEYPQHFNTFFKKHMGESPRQYKFTSATHI
ncbi:helix-turn-helix domain-containing protein [Sphingobacterium spiritivorum]|uniref:helix-turn-helix domain-containing protein n=1 Tax=Sphingobacterium TaxID=28453 RepID=UPI00191A8991|nr:MULTISPECIES: helix-turn-helix domain-containing protein [Sphingobacterium]QQT25817.1 AraC family transcriptional regulator [Sphingobacterium spiritivorum]